MTVDADVLRRLPRTLLVAPFTCEEGWTVPGLRWGGIRLADILALAQPGAEARFVRVWSGDYSISVRLQDAAQALVCDMLDDAPLTQEHGAPWRLVVRGGQCFSSVKWIDRMEVTLDAEPTTGEAIARQRLTRGG